MYTFRMPICFLNEQNIAPFIEELKQIISFDFQIEDPSVYEILTKPGYLNVSKRVIILIKNPEEDFNSIINNQIIKEIYLRWNKPHAVKTSVQDKFLSAKTEYERLMAFKYTEETYPNMSLEEISKLIDMSQIWINQSRTILKNESAVKAMIKGAKRCDVLSLLHLFEPKIDEPKKELPTSRKVIAKHNNTSLCYEINENNKIIAVYSNGFREKLSGDKPMTFSRAVCCKVKLKFIETKEHPPLCDSCFHYSQTRYSRSSVDPNKCLGLCNEKFPVIILTPVEQKEQS